MMSLSSLYHNASYLQRCQDTIDLALATHPRLMAVRIDLHFPNKELAADTMAISRFIGSLKAKLKANRKRKKKEAQGKRVHDTSLFYIWVREHGEESEQAHYHLVLMLNKDAFYSPGDFKANPADKHASPSLSVMAYQAWCSALGIEVLKKHATLVQFAKKKPCHFLKANERDTATYKEFLKHVSYLAKDRTKVYSKANRSLGCSAGGKR